MSDNEIDLDSFILDDAPEPVTLPRGQYNARLMEVKAGESSQKKTPFNQFSFQINEVVDIDDANLPSEGFDTNELVNKSVSTTLYLSKPALFMFKAFVKGLGVDTSGLTLTQVREALADVVGEDFTITTKLDLMTDVNNVPREDADGNPRYMASVARVTSA